MCSGGSTALTDVTAGIRAGTFTGLLVRNGAGETTLMQLLTGQRLPTAGRVRVLGQAPFEDSEFGHSRPTQDMQKRGHS